MKFINGITDYEEWREHSKDNKKHLERMSLISELLAKDELTILDYYRLVSAITVSKLTGKLEDFYSISTSVLMNPTCQNRAKCENCICKDCYASASVQRFPSLVQTLETNYLILNNFLMPQDVLATLAIPSINGNTRIESHGDVASEICAINYTRIVASHKHLTFAVFTKNLDMYREVFETEGKPDNMIFIASSPIVNKVMEIPESMKRYVDKVFTVYDPEYVKENGIIINCGDSDHEHKCKYCMRCYEYNNEYYINELKK